MLPVRLVIFAEKAFTVFRFAGIFFRLGRAQLFPEGADPAVWQMIECSQGARIARDGG